MRIQNIWWEDLCLTSHGTEEGRIFLPNDLVRLGIEMRLH